MIEGWKRVPVISTASQSLLLDTVRSFKSTCNNIKMAWSTEAIGTVVGVAIAGLSAIFAIWRFCFSRGRGQKKQKQDDEEDVELQSAFRGGSRDGRISVVIVLPSHR
jgi:plastocyanin domain-containing protein